MRTYEYIFDDDSMGLTLTIEGELTDFEDEEAPEVLIQSVSYGGKPINLWTLSNTYMNHLENKLFQRWCFEGRSA